MSASDVPSYLYSPRVTPINLSTLPYRVNALKFAPTSSAVSSSSSQRLLAVGSHQAIDGNRISLHHLDTDVDVITGIDQRADDGADDSDIGKEKLSDALAVLDVLGDVNDICWLRSRLLASATSTGSVHLIAHGQKPSSSLSIAHTLSPSPGLSVNTLDGQPASSSPLLAAAGDSAALYLIDTAASAPSIVRSLPAAATSSTLALRFASASTLLTAGLYPSLRLFDIRSQSSSPSLSLVTRKGDPTLSLSVHPARPDTVVAGSESGRVAVWDVRKGTAAVWEETVLGGAVNAVMFLPFDAATVVAAGEDGAVAALDFNRERRDPTQVDYGATRSAEVSSLLLHRCAAPVRDLDVERTSHTVCAGTDTQQLCTFQYLLS